MKIYDYKGFPNPTRVRIALEEKGIKEVEFVNINVPNGEHKEVAFLAKNPFGVVPILELNDGTIITECTAITEYIDNINGDPTLTGKTAREKGIIHMMQRRAEAGLLDAAATYFHHATSGLGPKIEIYQCEEWGIKQKERAEEGLSYFNKLLENQPFIAGSEFSMADITAFAGLSYVDFAKILIPSNYSHLLDWRLKISKRPSVLATA
jgi:glutathione S-transferase